MGVWNTATPAGSDAISGGDDRIRELKTAIQEALRGGATEGDEAVFPGASPLTAPIFRYRGLKGSTAARPAASAGGLYYNTTTGTFQRSNGSTWDDVTENAAFEAIHAADSISLASSSGVVTLTEAGNAFHVSGTEAVTQIAGWSSGIAIIRWTQARSITHHASNLIMLRGADQRVAAGDITVFQFVGTNLVREIGGLSVFGRTTLPTRQVLTSGTGATYTTPTGARQLRIRFVGGGGGGGGAAAGTGGTGGTTTFNSVTAIGGGGGSNYTPAMGGTGGTGGTGGSAPTTIRRQGDHGASPATGMTGTGASSSFGPGGKGVTLNGSNNTGAAAAANTGGGGSGGTNSSNQAGAGGGSGEEVDMVIDNPAATYTYTVGAGGTAGADTTNGGAGGSGVIVVEEIY